MKIKNIIFDWSGVISDDLAPVYEAVMHVFKKLGISELTKEEYKETFFLPYIDFYRKFVPNVKKEEVDTLFLEGFKQASQPKIFTGVKNVLEDLNNRNIRMFVLSSHPVDSLLKEAQEYGVKNLFEKIYGSIGDKIKGIKTLIDENGLNVAETIFIGDMVHDADAAKSANLQSALVIYGYDSRAKLERENPDFILDKLEDVKNII